MCPILFVVATVSFPMHKALITNFADFSSIHISGTVACEICCKESKEFKAKAEIP